MSISAIDIQSFAPAVDRLVRDQRLDDFDRLIATPSYETYPMAHRYEQLAFLESLQPTERSYVLFAFALEHLTRVVQAACAKLSRPSLADFFAGIELSDWEELEGESNPLIPSFFICTRARSLMNTSPSVCGVHSPEAAIVAGWLERIGEAQDWLIAQPRARSESDPFDVTVTYRRPPCPDMPTFNELAHR